jgi:hypothetical protein
MSDDEYHMVEFRSIATGEVQRVRGPRKTDAELQAEAEAAATENAGVMGMMGVIVKAPGPLGWGTKIFNAETGDEIKGIAGLTIRMAPDAYNTVEAEIVAAEFEVSGYATFYAADPSSGESKAIKRIEFADGTEWVP